MARKKVEKQPEAKPKKPLKQSTHINKTNREEYQNGQPCRHEDCTNTMRRLPCRYCGRTRMRGTTIIEDRIGVVYLERLREVDIKLHNELDIKQQENSVLHIYRPPKNADK
jgi:hypothetical protein